MLQFQHMSCDLFNFRCWVGDIFAIAHRYIIHSDNIESVVIKPMPHMFFTYVLLVVNNIDILTCSCAVCGDKRRSWRFAYGGQSIVYNTTYTYDDHIRIPRTMRAKWRKKITKKILYRKMNNSVVRLVCFIFVYLIDRHWFAHRTFFDCAIFLQMRQIFQLAQLSHEVQFGSGFLFL